LGEQRTRTFKDLSKSNLMKKIVVTTSWDDGHILDLKLARLLKKYSIKGTFYIPPRNREFTQSDLLTDRQITKLGKDFEIGGHTLTHPVLTKISLLEAEKEIVEGKRYLEKLTGQKLISFSYPRGKHNLDIQNLVKKSGFLYARTVERYKFTMPKNFYESPTSLHAFRQYQDVFKIARFSCLNPISFLENMNWENLAKRIFDSLKEGSVYHFWGHSWIIDRKKEWGKLENVLEYISNRPNVLYVENRDLAYE